MTNEVFEDLLESEDPDETDDGTAREIYIYREAMPFKRDKDVALRPAEGWGGAMEGGG